MINIDSFNAFTVLSPWKGGNDLVLNQSQTMISETKEYLQMNSDELCKHLVSFAMSDIKSKEVIEELKQDERYTSDYEFRAIVDFSDILSDTLTPQKRDRDWTKRIMRCIDIIERASALEMWELLAKAWNSLAVSYSNMQMFEHALESYSHALHVEATHGICKLSPVIYSNMVLIFIHIEEIDKGLKYIENAVKLLEENKEDTTTYWSKYVTIYTTYLYLKIRKKQYQKSELQTFYDRIMEVDIDKLSYQGKMSRLNAEFYYGFFHYDSKHLSEVLDRIKSELGERAFIIYCHECIDFSKYIRRDDSAYVQELIDLEAQGIVNTPLSNLKTYDILTNYYQNRKNQAKISEFQRKYIADVKVYLKEIHELQNHAIQTIEDLVIGNEYKKHENVEKTEFKLIVEETLKTKRKLEKAYDRIAVVGELGRKISSTTDLNEVISTIHRIIKEHVPMDFFTLMYGEQTFLRSLAVYFQDVVYDEVEIPLDDENSSMAQCYLKKEIIKFNEHIDVKSSRTAVFGDEESGKRSPEMISCIFIPLVVGQKVIGVFSVQSSQENAYDGETFEFLREIEPYLAIALNNAVKSKIIEKEIERRKKIQQELEEANAILEQISSMDGLTQISNRRDFEENFNKISKKAMETKRSIAVFMLDIDYFKRYNDTYGHFEGDKILKQVAKTFRKNLESIRGLSARFGGEEFIGAAIGLSVEQAKAIAKKMCEDISVQRIEHKVVPLKYLTVSVGVAITQNVDADIRSDLMRQADECLYKAKHSGRNQFVFDEI